MKKDVIGDPLDRVDGRLKVTGGAKYSGEYPLPGLTYGVLVPATIANGTVTAMDIKAAQQAPGVLAVITPFNAPKVPGYQPGAARPVRGLKLFNDNQVHFNGQPIALVVAETFERATYAATLIKTTYQAQPFETDFHKNFDKGVVPNEGRYKDYVRGEADAYKNAPVIVEQDYMLPSEMHNPMELHVTTAFWEGEDKVTLYTKSQGVIGSQRSIANAFGLDPANVQINLTTTPANSPLPAAVNYTCMVPAELTGTTCVMNPASTAAGATSGQTTLMITTAAGVPSAPQRKSPPATYLLLLTTSALAGMMGIYFAGRRKILPWRMRPAYLALGLLVIAAGATVGCTTAGLFTPKGPASISVTATSGGASVTTQVNINVN